MAPIAAPIPVPMPIFNASFFFVPLATFVYELVVRSTVRPCASCKLRNLTVIEARPFTLPPGSELTTAPSTCAPFLAITQSPSTMGRARLPINRSPSLSVLVESVLAVKIVMGVPARIVKTWGVCAGAGAATPEPAGLLATAPPGALAAPAGFAGAAPGLPAAVEVASAAGEADVRAAALLGEGEADG